MSASRAKRRCAGWGGSESGGAAVEFALVVPVFLALILGTFELGWAAHCGATVRSAVEHASRALISNPSTSADAIQAAAQAQLAGVPVDNLQITLDTETIALGQVVRVSWRYTYDTMLPLAPRTAFRFDSSLLVPIPSS